MFMFRTSPWWVNRWVVKFEYDRFVACRDWYLFAFISSTVTPLIIVYIHGCHITHTTNTTIGTDSMHHITQNRYSGINIYKQIYRSVSQTALINCSTDGANEGGKWTTDMALRIVTVLPDWQQTNSGWCTSKGRLVAFTFVSALGHRWCS